MDTNKQHVHPPKQRRKQRLRDEKKKKIRTQRSLPTLLNAHETSYSVKKLMVMQQQEISSIGLQETTLLELKMLMGSVMLSQSTLEQAYAMRTRIPDLRHCRLLSLVTRHSVFSALPKVRCPSEAESRVPLNQCLRVALVL